MVRTYLEPYSDEYALVENATVRTWTNNRALMDYELYEQLGKHVSDPIVGYIDGLHYQFEPSEQVLYHECVVPERDEAVDASKLLVQK